MKDLQYRLKPIELYTVLVLSGCYFLMLIIFSHITHSLTVLMASYHMFCNIIALTGCTLSIKYNIRTSNPEHCIESLNSKTETVKKPLEETEIDHRKLTNTYGWIRIDILTMLIYFIFLASLSLSLFVESFETLAHQEHEDPIDFSILSLILPIIGLIINGLCFILIGGYTCHQKNFLYKTSIDEVVIHNKTKMEDNIKTTEVNLSKDNNCRKHARDLIDLLQDISSTIIVLICIAIVNIFNDDFIAKLCDPLLSIILCIFLVSISYPKMKSTCLILLQTVPQPIDMINFEKQLIAKFPEIVSYHDFHIWQLTSDNNIATIHIKFKNPNLYKEIINNVQKFFVEQNLTLVTIQPEFQCSKLVQMEKLK